MNEQKELLGMLITLCIGIVIIEILGTALNDDKIGMEIILKKTKRKCIWIFIIFLVIVLAIIYSMFAVKFNFDKKYPLIKLATPLVALIAAIGAIISYFIKNESEKEDRENTRKIQVHSEAQWRKRLFDLVEKEELTKNDVIYFLSFFNSNNPTDDIDKLLMEICYNIATNNNGKIDNLLNKVKDFDIKKGCLKTLKVNKIYTISDLKERIFIVIPKSMTFDQQLLFRSAINLLLKRDWYRQNNKE